MSAGSERRQPGGGDGTEDAARPPALSPSPSLSSGVAGAGPGPGLGALAPWPGSPAATSSAPWPAPPLGAHPPASLWLELGPACMRAQQCPSESSGQTSGDLGTSSSSSGGGSSAGLSPGSDSDSSGVVCGGRGGMRGALSRSWSLESLRSATAGKGAAPPSAPPAPFPLPRLSSRAASLLSPRDCFFSSLHSLFRFLFSMFRFLASYCFALVILFLFPGFLLISHHYLPPSLSLLSPACTSQGPIAHSLPPPFFRRRARQLGIWVFEVRIKFGPLHYFPSPNCF